MKVKHLIGGGDYSSPSFQGENKMSKPIEVGDIIDGRRVTRVYTLCGGLAYESEPVKGNVKTENAVYFPEEPAKAEPELDMNLPEEPKEAAPEPEKPKRGRKKKEV